MRTMSDAYLYSILQRETVDVSMTSPARQAADVLLPTIHGWAGKWLVAVSPSGSFAKGTANRSGTDIDLLISLHDQTPDPLKHIHETLVTALTAAGHQPRRQNVSIGVNVNGYAVDLVPGKRQNAFTSDHSLYRRRADTWTKTNVDTHIATVQSGGHSDAIRILKLWRGQKGLDFPSFYLEMTVFQALAGRYGSLS